MNRRIAFWLTIMLLTGRALFAVDPLGSYIDWRFHPPQLQIRDIQGLNKRIVDGKLHLHIREFLELVLQNATDIQLTRLDVLTAANDILSSHAPFDPQLELDFTALRSVSPLSFFTLGGIGSSSGTGSIAPPGTGTGSGSAVPGGSQVILPTTISSLSQSSQAQFTELLPTGQTINATFTTSRSSGDDFLYPALFGSLNVSVTQHLLQGRTNLQAKGPLQVARTELLITSERSEEAIASSIALAAHQYWNAIELRDTIRVQEQSVDLARRSYDRDKKALDLGALAKLDIFQSETQVAERNRDLIASRFQYKSSLDAMRHLIGADLTPTLRATEIVLEDQAAALPDRSSVLPFEQALVKALEARPQARAAQQQTNVDALNIRVARDSLLPRLDVSVQGGATGPGFNQMASQTANPYPGLGSTLGQVLAFDYPSYGFAATLNFPFRNSTARAALSNSVVNRVHDQYLQRQTQQGITNDVRQALNSLDLANASIEAAIRACDLARQNVSAEQQKYELGTITAFEVLDSQTRLASAESALLAAYVSYQQAYIDYQRATWMLLDGLGMVVETPRVH